MCNPWILWGALILFRIVDYYNLKQMHTFIYLFYFIFCCGVLPGGSCHVGGERDNDSSFLPASYR